MKAPKARFKILPYTNPRTGTPSWRVTGTRRNGERIRENFARAEEAQYRHTELEGEFHAANGVAALRATRLTDEQVGIAEAAFKRLEQDGDLITAVDHWLRTGQPKTIKESPRLDEALKVYTEWLVTTTELRALTKNRLRNRVEHFVANTGNVRVTDVLPEHIEKYLAQQAVVPNTKDGYCRALSSFFSWCMKGKRHWCVNNPCYAVEIEGLTSDDDREPVVLPLSDCEALLRAAEKYENGRLVPYVVLCLFGGLRPFESARLTWDQVNLTDGEIRLKGTQTKTGKGRIVVIDKTLKAWLSKYRKVGEIYLSPYNLELKDLRASIGYGPKNDKQPDLKPWVPDVLRHTAISHYFRLTGSYGRTAEQFGNSEGIIKKHYQGRVTSADTKKFYALRPLK
ncbi:MAG: tyrosine-type recombinase/integrase [Verrucomicrobia bacterium]|jgi:integrase|nr:MAG: tyrosine-type recombinase/integrase [Verrucomicrobiota bacterium]